MWYRIFQNNANSNKYSKFWIELKLRHKTYWGTDKYQVLLFLPGRELAVGRYIVVIGRDFLERDLKILLDPHFVQNKLLRVSVRTLEEKGTCDKTATRATNVHYLAVCHSTYLLSLSVDPVMWKRYHVLSPCHEANIIICRLLDSRTHTVWHAPSSSVYESGMWHIFLL